MANRLCRPHHDMEMCHMTGAALSKGLWCTVHKNRSHYRPLLATNAPSRHSARKKAWQHSHHHSSSPPPPSQWKQHHRGNQSPRGGPPKKQRRLAPTWDCPDVSSFTVCNKKDIVPKELPFVQQHPENCQSPLPSPLAIGRCSIARISPSPRWCTRVLHKPYSHALPSAYWL